MPDELPHSELKPTASEQGFASEFLSLNSIAEEDAVSINPAKNFDVHMFDISNAKAAGSLKSLVEQAE